MFKKFVILGVLDIKHKIMSIDLCAVSNPLAVVIVRLLSDNSVLINMLGKITYLIFRQILKKC